MTFGLTALGFVRKTYADIVSDMEARAKALFGEDINLTERSPIGLWIRLNAWEISLAWEQAEAVYNAGYKDTAEGVALNHVGKYIGISRKQAAKATGQVTVTGDSGTEIPAGFILATGDGVQFNVVTAAKVGAGGTVVVDIEAVNAGETGNVPANTITEIINPKSGIASVINTTGTSGGTDMEMDDQFKIRYDRSVSRGGSSTAASIAATLLELSGVRDVLVQENTTMNEVNGIPAKSVAPFVFGGDNQEIAKAILKVKAGGIRSFGSTEITVTDSQGNQHIIGFSRPDIINIYVQATLETDSNFPVDGNEQVRTKIIQHIGGQDEDATEYDGLGLGEKVIYTKIIAAIQQVPGITDIPQLKVDTVSPPIGTSNILIAIDEVAQTNWEKVTVS